MDARIWCVRQSREIRLRVWPVKLAAISTVWGNSHADRGARPVPGGWACGRTAESRGAAVSWLISEMVLGGIMTIWFLASANGWCWW
ncbi:hypothetical protein GCM10027570_39760 [Streptomonospora sediminis]